MRKLLTLAAIAIMGIASTATAGVDIEGDTANSAEGIGDFQATLTYLATDANTASLTVSITNTTPVGGGFLTAFAFNNPNSLITGISRIGDPAFPNFNELLGGDVNGSPFGRFDFGLAIEDGSLQGGGGNPESGIGVGQTGIFTFNLVGSALNTLTEWDFIDELSTPPGDGAGNTFFLARFRAIDAGAGSDHVPALVVPEPASMLVWGGLGLSAIPVCVWQRRRRL
jgi:hypothetical protein